MEISSSFLFRQNMPRKSVCGRTRKKTIFSGVWKHRLKKLAIFFPQGIVHGVHIFFLRKIGQIVFVDDPERKLAFLHYYNTVQKFLLTLPNGHSEVNLQMLKRKGWKEKA